MPQLKAVVFDLGKVLLDFDYRIAVNRLAPDTRLSPDELNALLNQSPLLLRYEAGQFTSEQFYETFRETSGFRRDFAEFSRRFSDIFTPIQPMIALHGELRARGVPTVVFSNTNDLQARHIRQSFPFFSTFDRAVLSFEHGAVKPDPHLYQLVEQVAGCRGPELFYIDDRPENVEAGRQRHWQARVHHDPAQTRQALADAGLPVDRQGAGVAGR